MEIEFSQLEVGDQFEFGGVWYVKVSDTHAEDIIDKDLVDFSPSTKVEYIEL